MCSQAVQHSEAAFSDLSIAIQCYHDEQQC